MNQSPRFSPPVSLSYRVGPYYHKVSCAVCRFRVVRQDGFVRCSMLDDRLVTDQFGCKAFLPVRSSSVSL